MTLVRKTVEIEVIDHEETGAAVRAARKKARLSMGAVAKRAGFSTSYISNLESGNRPWTQYLYDTIMTSIEELK